MIRLTLSLSYVDRDTAIQENLVFVNDEGHAIIQGDNTTWLQPGEYRKRYLKSLMVMENPLSYHRS